MCILPVSASAWPQICTSAFYQWCNQDFSRPRPRPSLVFKTKTKTLHLQTKTKTFLWCILEADRKHLSFSTVNENADENEIPFTAENENGHSFSAENENKSHLIIIVFFFLFHTFSHQLSQPYNAPPIPCPVLRFLQVVLVDGIPLSSCTVYICGIFLDDISTRKQFVFLVYCYRVKAIFHNLCCTGVCVT